MKIKIPYGNSFKILSIPEHKLISVISPHEVNIEDERKSIVQALGNPLGCKSFSQFLGNIKKILIIINDGTRPTPTEKVIDSMYDIMQDREIYFLVATGTHRAPNTHELKRILGKYYKKYRENILIHDSDNSKTKKAGITARGTEVYYNKNIYDFDRIISVSSVEPHYFAGFTGGRKSFLPGVSSFKTTEMNHKLALDPQTAVLKLKGNPLHEDLNQALRFLNVKNIFSVQTVLNQREKVYFTAAGNIEESFLAAAEKCLDVFSVPLQEKADVVIAAVTPPMDINLYQSHKAMQHAGLALKPGGIIILVSPCSEGMGNEVFSRILYNSETQDQLFKNAEKNFILGTQTAIKFAELSKQAQLWGVTEIDPAILQSMFMKPFTSVQKAVNEALLIKPESKILVLMNATLTVPIITDTTN